MSASYYQYQDTLANTSSDFVARLNAAFTAAGIPLEVEYGDSAPFLKFYNTQGTRTLVMQGCGSGENDTTKPFAAVVNDAEVEFLKGSTYCANGRYFGIGATNRHVALCWGANAATNIQNFIIFGKNRDGAPVALANTDVTTGGTYIQDKDPKTVVLDGTQSPYGLTFTASPLVSVIAGMEMPLTVGETVEGAYWLAFPGNYPQGCTVGYVNNNKCITVCGYWLLFD